MKSTKQKDEHIAFEWSKEIMPGAVMSKLPGSRLHYVILPTGLDVVHNCQGAVVKFGTPKGLVNVRLEVADSIEFSQDLFDAARHGMGLLPKAVQERMGHSSITMTYDLYGHLFPRGDDAKVLDAVEGALIATHTRHAG